MRFDLWGNQMKCVQNNLDDLQVKAERQGIYVTSEARELLLDNFSFHSGILGFQKIE